MVETSYAWIHRDITNGDFLAALKRLELLGPLTLEGLIFKAQALKGEGRDADLKKLMQDINASKETNSEGNFAEIGKSMWKTKQEVIEELE